jgi:hypothetical protein
MGEGVSTVLFVGGVEADRYVCEFAEGAEPEACVNAQWAVFAPLRD